MLIRLRHNWPLLVVLGLYLCLSVAYGLVNPIFEANDEVAHYLYIRQLVNQRRLPIQQIPAGKDYQNHHPPVYYLLGAVATFWIDDSDLPSITARKNAFWGYDPWSVGRDNKNQFLYAPFQRFPGSGTVRRLRLVRLLSTMMGLGTLLATYLAAREVFPAQRHLALGGLAFVAFHPMFLYLSGAINNDNLLVFWGAFCTWQLMRLLRRGFSWSRILALGIALGLALLTKISAVFLLPAVAAGLCLTAWRWRAWKRLWQSGLVIGSAMLLLSGWWFLRNWLLYGEPTGIGILASSIDLSYPSRPSLWQGFATAFRFQKSFWACFGWNTIPVPYDIYWALDGVALVAIVGVCLLSYRSWRHGNRVRLAQVGLLTLIAILFVSAWAYYLTVSRTAGYGRYAFPALGAMSLLLFSGLAQVVPSQWRALLAWAVHAAMLSFAVYCLVGILIPAYSRPRLMKPPEIEAIPHRLNVHYGEKIRLLGSDIQPAVARPGDEVTVTLYWQALQAMDTDYIIFVHLFGQNGQKIGQRDTHPGLGRFPTSLWQPGDVFADVIRVPIYPESGIPVVASVETGLYSRKPQTRLQAFDDQGRDLEQTIIGRVKLPPPEGEQAVMPLSVDYTFDDGITLRGYEIDRPLEGDWYVTLYWLARGRPRRDYSIFIHLVDERGYILAQGDGPPVRGDYPTSAWDAGELVTDRHSIVFGAAIAHPVTENRERLRWRVGLYDLASMERLPAYGPGGLRLAADQIELKEE